MTVYVIEADLTGQDRVEKRDALGKAIGALAKSVNEPVFFHDFKDTQLGGAPVVLLECSDAFLDKVKQLPEFEKTFPAWSNIDTERSAHLWHYFTNTPTCTRGAKKPQAPKP